MDKLRAESITVSYESTKIIEDICLTLGEGEIVSLLGVSGSGKTTLFNVLSGLSKPDTGRVYLEEKDITGLTGSVSYMLQKDLLLPHYTILDNVALPLTIGGTKKKEARDKASVYFSDFGLEGTEKKYPHQLSGGMRQRAAFLRSYLMGSDVLLLDEPFSALDAITKSGMHKWFLDITEKIGLSVLMITHDIDEAILLSDRIYILSGIPGKITAEITVPFKKPHSPDLNMTTEFLELKKEILGKIYG